MQPVSDVMQEERCAVPLCQVTPVDAQHHWLMATSAVLLISVMKILDKIPEDVSVACEHIVASSSAGSHLLAYT